MMSSGGAVIHITSVSATKPFKLRCLLLPVIVTGEMSSEMPSMWSIPGVTGVLANKSIQVLRHPCTELQSCIRTVMRSWVRPCNPQW